MTDADLDTLQALSDAATKPPWKAETTWNNGGMPLADFTLPGSINGATIEMLACDAHFAVAARTAVPALIADVRELQAKLAEMTAARDEACDWAYGSGDKWREYGLRPDDLKRLAALRAVGKETP